MKRVVRHSPEDGRMTSPTPAPGMASGVSAEEETRRTADVGGPSVIALLVEREAISERSRRTIHPRPLLLEVLVENFTLIFGENLLDLLVPLLIVLGHLLARVGVTAH